MGNPIRIVRGTNLSIVLTLTEDDGTPHTLESGETLKFGVKRSPYDSACIFTKTATSPISGSPNEYVFSTAVSDTATLEFGEYFYDVGLQTGSSGYVNVISTSPFIIEYNVTGVG